MGTWLVVLLLVLDAAVVLEEELTGLLEHPAALADWTGGGVTQYQKIHITKCCISTDFTDSINVYCNVTLLSFAGPVEEVGPFGAGLFAADPEHCRYSNHQSHQVFYQEQGQVRAVVLSSLIQKQIKMLTGYL